MKHICHDRVTLFYTCVRRKCTTRINLLCRRFPTTKNSRCTAFCTNRSGESTHLDDVVGPGSSPVYAGRSHHSGQAVPFHQEVIPVGTSRLLNFVLHLCVLAVALFLTKDLVWPRQRNAFSPSRSERANLSSIEAILEKSFFFIFAGQIRINVHIPPILQNSHGIRKQEARTWLAGGATIAPGCEGRFSDEKRVSHGLRSPRVTTPADKNQAPSPHLSLAAPAAEPEAFSCTLMTARLTDGMP